MPTPPAHTLIHSTAAEISFCFQVVRGMESNADTRKRKCDDSKEEAERDKAVPVAALVGKVAECM